MPNPLFNALGGNIQPADGMTQLLQDLMQFKNNFKGDARQEVMKQLQSGRISQQELNQLQMQAEQIQRMMRRIK